MKENQKKKKMLNFIISYFPSFQEDNKTVAKYINFLFNFIYQYIYTFIITIVKYFVYR